MNPDDCKKLIVSVEDSNTGRKCSQKE